MVDLAELIGNNLKKLRMQKGVTIRELAEAINTSHSAVSAWENGKKIPRDTTLIKLADYYGVDVADITTNEPAAKRAIDLAPTDIVDIEKLLDSKTRLVFGGKELTRKERNIAKRLMRDVVIDDIYEASQEEEEMKVEENKPDYPVSTDNKTISIQKKKDDELEKRIAGALDGAVAHSGKRLTEEDREFFGNLLREMAESEKE